MEIKFAPTTPIKQSLSIKMFLKEIGLKSHPRFLKFTNKSEKYLPNFCLSNCEVEHAISKSPILYGWSIWEDKQQHFIEAEFHAVLLISNELVDITPRVDGEEKILWVHDPHRKAVRVNEKTWDTWTSFKSHCGIIAHYSSQVLMVNEAQNHPTSA
jgi:hypothetical protein